MAEQSNLRKSEVSLVQVEMPEPIPLLSGEKGVTLLQFSKEDQLTVIEVFTDWIKSVVKESLTSDALNPRSLEEIINILLGGFGDILFLVDQNKVLTPVSILLLTPTITERDQRNLYTRMLGKGNPGIFQSIRTAVKIFESNLAFTVGAHRGKWFNSELRYCLYPREQYKGGIIVVNSCNPYTMIMYAREGLVPISHKKFPLTTTLISFFPFPDVFYGVKVVPELEKVRWMSMEDAERWREFLAKRVEEGGYDINIDDLPVSPVIFVSMEERLPFIFGQPFAEAYRNASPHPYILELEVTLQHAIFMSPGFYEGGYWNRGEKGQVEFLHKVLYETSLELQDMLSKAAILSVP